MAPYDNTGRIPRKAFVVSIDLPQEHTVTDDTQDDNILPFRPFTAQRICSLEYSYFHPETVYSR